jgi:D-sedoheptulose 7-phosphate isomerase
MENLKKHFKKSASIKDFGKRYLSYLNGLMQNLDMDVVSVIVEEMERVSNQGKTLYLIGNGGSAATASHYANDLRIGIRSHQRFHLKAVSLADNLSLLTALANDEGYDNIFVQQLEGVLDPDDIVMAFSVSGNSENVIQAMMFSRMIGATTIGLTGFDGGKLRKITDINLHVPTLEGEYGPVEDVFSIIGHLIYSFMKMDRASQSDHMPVQEICRVRA